MRVERKLAEALSNLRGNRDFNTFTEALAENIGEHLLHCATHEGNDLYRAQGAVKALQAWQKEIHEAPATLEKLMKQSNLNPEKTR